MPDRARRPAARGPVALLLLALVAWLGGCGSDPVASTPVQGVSVSPSEPTVRLGETVRLTATVNVAESEGGSRTVHWSSADAAVATVDANGVVTPHAVGTVQIAASAGGQSGVATVRVLGRAVYAVELTASATELAVGDTVRLTSVVAAANGETLADRPVALSTLDPTIVRVLGDGAVVGLDVGTARMVAVSEGVADTTILVVRAAAVATVELTPTVVALVVGEVGQLTAVARDRFSNVLTGRTVTFTSSVPAVATVNGEGAITALATGATTITATVDGVSANASVTVNAIPVATITVTPPTLNLILGGTAPLNAVARDGGNNVLPGRPVAFSSSAPAVATVTNQGLVTAVGLGTATITATAEGKTGTATVTVRPPSVASVQVTPATAQLAVGETRQLATQALDDRGAPLTGRLVAYTSSAPTVASVSTSGLVTALAAGSATITATVEGKTATMVVTVAPVPVATVTLTPATVSLTAGATQQLTVVARDAGGTTLSGRPVTFTSSAPTVATVNATGVVTAVAAGSAIVIATVEGVADTTAVTVTASGPPPVTPGPPARVEIVSGSLQIGARRGELTNPLVVRVVDAADRPVPGVTVTWAANRGGTLAPSTVVTGATGRASVRWTLGNPAGTQEAVASVAGAGSATFFALAIGGGE